MSRKYFINNQPEDNLIILRDNEFHHIINVMRTKIGENVNFTDGKGNNYITILENINANQAFFKVIDNYFENDTDFEILVCAGLMKGDKNELVIQKCAELGVTKLLFFESEFCIAKAKDKLERYYKISQEASKQSGRSTTMDILPTIKFKQLKDILNEYDTVLCAYEKNRDLNSYDDIRTSKKIAIIIGSEGGFSEKEINFLKENTKTQIISLGKRILRAETAVIALTTIIMHEKGEI